MDSQSLGWSVLKACTLSLCPCRLLAVQATLSLSKSLKRSHAKIGRSHAGVFSSALKVGTVNFIRRMIHLLSLSLSLSLSFYSATALLILDMCTLSGYVGQMTGRSQVMQEAEADFRQASLPTLLFLIANFPHVAQSFPCLCQPILQLQNFNL